MPVKILFVLLAFITALKVSGQKIELRNLTVTDQNSKTIYLDIENIFKISGLIEHVTEESGTTRFIVRKDTLILLPTTAGNVTISFATKYDKQRIVFTAKELSPMTISVGGETNKLISKAGLLKNKEISIQKNNPFFENYKVDSFVVNITGQTFRISSDKLSDELLMAVNKAKSGDHLEFVYVHAVNPGNGRKIGIKSKISFELK